MPVTPVMAHVGVPVGAGSEVLVPLTVAVKVRVFPIEPVDTSAETETVGVFFSTAVVVDEASDAAL